MKKITVVVFIIVAGIYQYSQNNLSVNSSNLKQPKQRGQTITQAFQAQASGIQVSGAGVVKHILSDDNKGSRHQRFILALPSGRTVLVAHNIDLAPKITEIKKGDTVHYFGQYEWNAKGGVLHWTHHDPSGRHVGGWLKHNGRTYQ